VPTLGAIPTTEEARMAIDLCNKLDLLH